MSIERCSRNTGGGLLLALLFQLAWLLVPQGGAWAAPAGPILIAHVAPTTGRFALHAEADRRGAEMAIEDFNRNGGVLGREIVLISRNPGMDGKQAAQVAEELIVHNRVGFMVGAIASNVAASMSAVAQKYGVIYINTNSSAPSESVENAHRSKFVFDASGANFNRALFQYALKNRPSKRVLQLTEDNEAGRSNAAAMRNLYRRVRRRSGGRGPGSRKPRRPGRGAAQGGGDSGRRRRPGDQRR